MYYSVNKELKKESLLVKMSGNLPQQIPRLTSLQWQFFQPVKGENERYQSKFNNKIKEHSKLQLEELSKFFNPKFKTCCQNVKNILKKQFSVLYAKGNYFATKAAHTVVLRANQRGVKMLRKKMAKAAQKSTPPQVVKSYCW